jgi:hypothetical protein
MGIRSGIFSLPKKKYVNRLTNRKMPCQRIIATVLIRNDKTEKKRIGSYTLCLFIFLSLQYTQNLLTKKRK